MHEDESEEGAGCMSPGICPPQKTMALDVAACISTVTRRHMHAKNILGAMSMPGYCTAVTIGAYVEKERQVGESAHPQPRIISKFPKLST
jgi:hypothetical protein